MKEWREETLDPVDWDEMSVLAKQMAEDMIRHQQNIRELPIYIEPTSETMLNEPLPREPSSPKMVYQEFREKIMKNLGAGSAHPGWWNTVMGTGTPLGALADMWMSGLNTVSTTRGLGSLVEIEVVFWFKEMLGYPSEASGVLSSGGSMANLLGLIVARNAKAGYDIKKEGCRGDLVFYGSKEMHYCIQKNLESMGVGSDNLRKIPVDEYFRVRVDELRSQVERDRADGLKPVCVVGCAGTTNTGSIDDLVALADFCEEEGLWFHVDAAFGAWAAIAPDYGYLVRGMDRADSLAVDLHKWMYMPYGIGLTLVRDSEAHYASFRAQADYIEHERALVDLTLELSRPMRALKAWMSLKEHGADKYGRLIQQNILHAQYLAGLIERSRYFVLTAPVALNVVCCTLNTEGLDQDTVIRVMKGIEPAFFADIPDFIPGNTMVNGIPCIRFCFTNHRTTRVDIDMAVEWMEKTVARLLEES